ncbi:transposase [Agrococcus sp. Marseille-Q4369]|uniref:transposase n=1 Tax=Agrococcus sp. Marseille-Q4369 TaxID=2810513 RepID=UPI001B8AAA8C|nr:transposase [Agrococcus sp. Marseille-Q4369]QUW19709.1 transposase [Agrococcus sp. Marseille-Q4369]
MNGVPAWVCGGVAGEWVMAVNVRSGDLDQLFLMPPSVRDWLPEDHLAFFVLDTVAELDLTAFYASYPADGRGGAVYDPALMLGVLLYAYCTGERSSRRIERKLVEDVAYRVLAVNQTPDHATLARFRSRHQEAIAALFGQVLGLCVKAGIVDAGMIAIDGTKIAADASFFANRSREDLAAEILDEAEQTDAAEDALFGDRRGDELPAAWSGGRDRRERIRAALDELEREKARDYESRVAERERKEAASGKQLTGPKPRPDTARRAKPRRANTTDPHSRIIPNTGRGAMQGYNAQTAATAGGQIVVAAEVTVTTNDQPHFVPMATAVTENLADAGHDEPVGTFVADAGYWTAANGTADVGAEVLIATKKPADHRAERPDDHKLSVLAKVNRGELSQRKAGEILGVSYTWVGDMTKRYFGKDGPRAGRAAEPTPAEWLPVIERLNRGEINKREAAGELMVSGTRINSMLAHVRGEAVEPSIARAVMDEKLAEPRGSALYAQRQHTIEPVFGNIKGNLGYRRFTRRGLDAVQSEWRLICAAHNLLKLRTAGA